MRTQGSRRPEWLCAEARKGGQVARSTCVGPPRALHPEGREAPSSSGCRSGGPRGGPPSDDRAYAVGRTRGLTPVRAPGRTLIDNWRMLHGRADGPSGDAGERRLQRVLVGGSSWISGIPSACGKRQSCTRLMLPARNKRASSSPSGRSLLWRFSAGPCWRRCTRLCSRIRRRLRIFSTPSGTESPSRQRSIPAVTVFRRCVIVVEEFTESDAKGAIGLIELRNQGAALRKLSVRRSPYRCLAIRLLPGSVVCSFGPSKRSWTRCSPPKRLSPPSR